MYDIQGSPPQVRGKRWGWIFTVDCDRITPAGAGKTLRLYPYTNRCKDHPRRCGENL